MNIGPKGCLQSQDSIPKLIKQRSKSFTMCPSTSKDSAEYRSPHLWVKSRRTSIHTSHPPTHLPQRQCSAERLKLSRRAFCPSQKCFPAIAALPRSRKLSGRKRKPTRGLACTMKGTAYEDRSSGLWKIGRADQEYTQGLFSSPGSHASPNTWASSAFTGVVWFTGQSEQ